MKKTDKKIFDVDGELNDRAKRFCKEYIRLKFNGTEAAIAAGYSPKTAASQAARLLANAKVEIYLKDLKKNLSEAIGIDAVRIAQEYARIGFSDIRQIFDDKGNLINVKDIGDDPAANIASVEVFEEFEGRGEDRTFIGNTKKVRFYDKVAALDKLSRMLGVDGVTKVQSTNLDYTVPVTKEEAQKIAKDLEDSV